VLIGSRIGSLHRHAARLDCGNAPSGEVEIHALGTLIRLVLSPSPPHSMTSSAAATATRAVGELPFREWDHQHYSCGSEFIPQVLLHDKPQPAQRPSDEPDGLEAGAGLATLSPRQPRRSRVKRTHEQTQADLF
jgi:hypothetical protein